MTPDPSTDAEAITRKSGSNFALAFFLLPRDRCRDITTFYAFCRVVDDIADEPGVPVEEKQRALEAWRRALRVPQGPIAAAFAPLEAPQDSAANSATHSPEASFHEPPLAPAVRGLIVKYGIDPGLLEEIVLGCGMDCGLTCEPDGAAGKADGGRCGEQDAPPTIRYATWVDLQRYCYRVASAVGLVSIQIFGAKNPATRQYAIELGYALQLTNILRDVAKDLANDRRIYLPLEDLARFGLAEADLLALLSAAASSLSPSPADQATEPLAGPPAVAERSPNNPLPCAEIAARFQALMRFEVERAEALYARAVAALPREDAHAMAAAELMRRVYHRLLRKMRRDGFRVFERANGRADGQTYRLTKLEKIAAVLSTLWARFWTARRG